MRFRYLALSIKAFYACEQRPTPEDPGDLGGEKDQIVPTLLRRYLSRAARIELKALECIEHLLRIAPWELTASFVDVYNKTLPKVKWKRKTFRMPRFELLGAGDTSGCGLSMSFLSADLQKKKRQKQKLKQSEARSTTPTPSVPQGEESVKKRTTVAKAKAADALGRFKDAFGALGIVGERQKLLRCRSARLLHIFRQWAKSSKYREVVIFGSDTLGDVFSSPESINRFFGSRVVRVEEESAENEKSEGKSNEQEAEDRVQEASLMENVTGEAGSYELYLSRASAMLQKQILYISGRSELSAPADDEMDGDGEESSGAEKVLTEEEELRKFREDRKGGAAGKVKGGARLVIEDDVWFPYKIVWRIELRFKTNKVRVGRGLKTIVADAPADVRCLLIRDKKEVRSLKNRKEGKKASKVVLKIKGKGSRKEDKEKKRIEAEQKRERKDNAAYIEKVIGILGPDAMSILAKEKSWTNPCRSCGLPDHEAGNPVCPKYRPSMAMAAASARRSVPTLKISLKRPKISDIGKKEMAKKRSPVYARSPSPTPDDGKKRVRGRLSRRDALRKLNALFKTIVRELMSQAQLGYFIGRVPDSVKGYYDIIETEMHFSAISKRTSAANNYQSLGQFMDDLELIKQNAITFNGEESVIGKASYKVIEKAEELLSVHMSDIRSYEEAIGEPTNFKRKRRGQKRKVDMDEEDPAAKKARTLGSGSSAFADDMDDDLDFGASLFADDVKPAVRESRRKKLESRRKKWLLLVSMTLTWMR